MIRSFATLLTGAIIALCSATPHAEAQTQAATAKPIIFALLGEPSPDNRLQWGEGISGGGSESFRDFLYSGSIGEISSDRVILRAAHGGLRVDLENPVYRPAGGMIASVAAEKLTMIINMGQMTAWRDRKWPLDLCTLWSESAGLNAKGLRIVYDPQTAPTIWGSRIHSATAREANLEVSPDAAAVMPGLCETLGALKFDQVEVMTRNKSGFTALGVTAELRGPSSLASLLNKSAPPYISRLAINSSSIFIANGLQAITLVGASLTSEVNSASVTGLVATFLEASRAGTTPSYAQVWNDIWKVQVDAKLETQDVVVKVQNVLPTSYTVGVERAQLRNLIGSYDAGFMLRESGATLQFDTQMVGVAKLKGTAQFGRLEPKEGRQGIPLSFRSLEVTHEDMGFATVFEMVASNPFPIFLILRTPGWLAGLPEAAHPAIREALAGLTRYVDAGIEGPVRFVARGPVDISMHEIVWLLKRRPELLQQVFAAQIIDSSAPPTPEQ